jgi:hypothetical protein
MQYSCSDTPIEESRQPASSMTRQRDEVDFLPHGEIDNRPYNRAEQHMHVRSNPLLSQARLKSFKVIPSIFGDSVDYSWIQGGDGASHVDRRRDRFDHLEQEHLRLVISVGEIFNVRKDYFRAFGSIQGY